MLAGQLETSPSAQLRQWQEFVFRRKCSRDVSSSIPCEGGFAKWKTQRSRRIRTRPGGHLRHILSRGILVIGSSFLHHVGQALHGGFEAKSVPFAPGHPGLRYDSHSH